MKSLIGLLLLCLGLGVQSHAASGPGQHASAGKEVGSQGEADWKDARWDQTDVGPFLCSGIKTPEGLIAKGLFVRVGSNSLGGMCFDMVRGGFRGAWEGGWLKFSSVRFGLLDMPRPATDWIFTTTQHAGWTGNVIYRSLRVHDQRILLEYSVEGSIVRETPWMESIDGQSYFYRDFEMGPSHSSLQHQLCGPAQIETSSDQTVQTVTIARDGKTWGAALRLASGARFVADADGVSLAVNPHSSLIQVRLIFWTGKIPPQSSTAFWQKLSVEPGLLASLAQPGLPHWTPAITNQGIVGFAVDGFATDTVTMPYVNPWKALLFGSGVDFFDDGSAVVSTIHGDVWHVSGLDASLRRVVWKRYATGLYQPLGLRVVGNQVYVLGRDRITILRDENNDKEADVYESFCDSIHTSTGGHDYVTCLERDAAGNFYYVDPLGVHRISPDGKRNDTLAAGLRNPNGLGVGPGPLITATPQQGTWTPSSAIFEIKEGGWYGFGGPKSTSSRPEGFDAPLCWLPHGFDNSSASQVWVPKGQWGDLESSMLHLLWGRCGLALVLRDVVNGIPQGAAVALPPKFLSGPMRGTFHPKDGHLYIAGSTGWQTSATQDGALQRIRRMDGPARTPVSWHAHRNGIVLGFAQTLDSNVAEDPGSYSLTQWNYRYTKEYGSKDYSVKDPSIAGRDEVIIRSTKLLPDQKHLIIETDPLKPVMQMELKYRLRFAKGGSVAGPLYLTLNSLDTNYLLSKP